MKKISLFFLLTLCVFCFGQKLKEVETFNYNEFSDSNFRNKYSNNCIVGTYITEDGNSIKKGDTLKLGIPSNKQGTGGDFSFLIFGTLNGTLLRGIDYVNGTLTGNYITIEEIQIFRSMGTYGIKLQTQPVQGQKIPLTKYITVLNFDQAYNTGEILLTNAKITKEQAIKLLKEKKDLLDLGIITQEEFDRAKEELTPTIIQ
ncbi:hypothetical protein ETU08_07585 [Apibacter muscae]|uniref:hypothetical protein n=1 Tax=Apibacter muscae TaxID=2509004 RepID=UPI0011AD27D3|nr:hypothetical protein [Apibacter muscae]TWP29354.1 hypothetical protein ETU08_07585 [Apibacter muscae]